jgi:hypothetical protein
MDQATVKAPPGWRAALQMLENIAAQARAQGQGADEALLSACWLAGYLSTLLPDGLATAERHADRVAHARELLPLLALARAWQVETEGRA